MHFDRLEPTDQPEVRQPEEQPVAAELGTDTVNHFSGEGSQNNAAAEANGDHPLPPPRGPAAKVARPAGSAATQAALAETGAQDDGKDSQRDTSAGPGARPETTAANEIDETDAQSTVDTPDDPDRNAEAPERGLNQEAADRLFDECSGVAADLVGTWGSADIVARPGEGTGKPEPGNRVGVYAQTGRDPLTHPDIVELDFGERPDYDEAQGGPKSDFVQLRRETDGRITVLTSDAIMQAPRRPDGSIEVPSPSDDPEIVAAAFNRVQAAFAHVEVDGDTTSPPEWPPAVASNDIRFEDAMGTAKQMDESGKGFYVNTGRAGMNPDDYDTRITNTHMETDSQGRTRDSLRVDFEPVEDSSAPPISVTIHHNHADGAVTVDYSPANAADLLGFNTSTEGDSDNAEEQDQPLTTENALDVASAALNLEDYAYQALVAGTSRLEQALDGADDAEMDTAEAADDTAYTAEPRDADVEPPAAGSENTAANEGETTGASGAASTESQGATGPSSAEATSAPEAAAAPADREEVVVEDVTGTVANEQVLRQAGAPPEMADAPTTLLQLTGRAVGQLFTALRERVEVATIRRETEVVNVLTLIDDAYHRVDLIETNVTGSANPTPTQYYLRSTLRHEAERIMARAQGRNFQAAAGALGTRALMQSIADTHRARVIARNQRTAVRYQAMAARQRMGVQRQRLAAAAPRARGNGTDRNHPQAARIQAAMRRAQHIPAEVPRFHSRTRAVGRAAVRSARGVVRAGGRAARIYLDITTGVPSRPQRPALRRSPDAPRRYEHSRPTTTGNTRTPNQQAPGTQPAGNPTGTPLQPNWPTPPAPAQPDEEDRQQP